MTDETKDLEPMVEEGAPPAEERAPLAAAEPEVEKEPKESPDKDKALREARRDAKKAARKTARLEQELERRRKMGPTYMQAPPDDPQVLRQEAMAYRQMQQDAFITESLQRLSLEREDKRLDYTTPETFLASAAVARQEDLEEREAELEEAEEKLESLEKKLVAKYEERLSQLERDFRREAGVDKVAKVTPSPGGSEAKVEAIEEKYRERLAILKRSGHTAEAYRVLKEKEAEIEAARAEE